MSRNKLNVNGRTDDATASSLFVNVKSTPPLALLASMKLNAGAATFVLAAVAVTLKIGPDVEFPKTETVIGPVDAPKGTRTVNATEVAVRTRPGTPLN